MKKTEEASTSQPAVTEASPSPKPWTIQDSANLYHIENWGSGHFSVNQTGNIVCSPLLDNGAGIPLMAVVEEAKKRGLSFPLQIRFHDLLKHRVRSINHAFKNAIEELAYQNHYQGVFPIKVNQLREVVEEILDAGREFHYGLEAGSKPELVASLAMLETSNSLIICNGYKDEQFVRLALLGLKIGRKVILVVEKMDELHLVMKAARTLGVSPVIGFRIRLSSKGHGKWAESGGENAKFGLSVSEALEAWEILQDQGFHQSVQLLHFHIGSQVPDIMHIKKAVREAARYYSKFVQLGEPLKYMDVGGGLAIDYDGSSSARDSSMNYSLEEYARTVIENIKDVCDEEKVAHPIVVSESGRFVVAPHTVLIVEAFENVEKTHETKSMKITSVDREHKLIREILNLRRKLSQKKNLIEVYHSLQHLKEESIGLFDVGLLDLVTKAKIENLYWETLEQIVLKFRNNGRMPDEIHQAGLNLSKQYICNFSIFQSLLDHWAIGQLFPIVPVHRLNEKPENLATLVDITCDSEGKIDNFIGDNSVCQELPVHEIGKEPYYLGIFLIGAYQDIMGDQHNLFGRTNEVHIFLDPDEENGYYIEEVIPGATIEDVLSATQYSTHDLIRRFKELVEAAIREDRVKPTAGIQLLEEYRKAFSNYTYLYQPASPEF